MTTAIGFYTPGSSWLYRLDPRVKLWLSASGILLCLLTGRLELLALLLALAQGLLLVGGLPASRLMSVWRRVLFILVVIMLLQPLITPGAAPPILQIGPVQITQDGLLLALRYALRVAAAAFFALIPIMTTPINALVRGLQKIGLPYAWGMAVGLALRYLGTIGDLYISISEAQQARGSNPAIGSVIQRVRAAVPVLIAVIIASLRLSDSLALGMAARGYGLSQTRTWRQDIAMSPADWLALALITGLSLALAAIIIS